jgi:hypothetical protein
MIDFDYKVVRRARRKTASISVKADNSVIVTVPEKLPRHQVHEIVRSKADWIRSKIRFNQEVREKLQPREYVSGEVFTYLGNHYHLEVIEDEARPTCLSHGNLIVCVPSGTSVEDRERLIIRQLTAWYQDHALKRLWEKTEHFASSLGITPPLVEIKSYKSRWGSCTRHGEIYYNWRIIIAPNAVVDYVVVHELCHLIHHNHSGAYWKLVESILPDYRESREWLKINGSTLDI